MNSLSPETCARSPYRLAGVIVSGGPGRGFISPHFSPPERPTHGPPENQISAPATKNAHATSRQCERPDQRGRAEHFRNPKETHMAKKARKTVRPAKAAKKAKTSAVRGVAKAMKAGRGK